jgi:hypothetical protein
MVEFINNTTNKSKIYNDTEEEHFPKTMATTAKDISCKSLDTHPTDWISNPAVI